MIRVPIAIITQLPHSFTPKTWGRAKQNIARQWTRLFLSPAKESGYGRLGMARVKSHVIYIQNLSKLGEYLERTSKLTRSCYKLTSSYTSIVRCVPPTLSTRVRPHATSRFSCRHNYSLCSSLVNRLSRRLLERVDVLIFYQTALRVGRGVYSPQAIVSFWHHVYTLPSRNSAQQIESQGRT